LIEASIMGAAETKSTAEQNPDVPANSAWQYSLRSLFVVTTVASIGLAIGVHYGGFVVVAVAAGLIFVGGLLAADWLIRPENRRPLAFVTASAWFVIGSGIAMLGVETFFRATSLGKQELGWSVGAIFVVAGLFCYGIALWRWRKLATPKDRTITESKTS
jgi:hypothetical protein